MGIETARAVAGVEQLLGPPVHAAYFAAEDFIADMGGRRTPGGHEVLYARSRVVLAARLAGVIAIDQAVVEVRDEDAFRQDARGSSRSRSVTSTATPPPASARCTSWG